MRSREPTFRDLRDPSVLQKAYQWLSHCKERHTACHAPKYMAVQPPQQSQQSFNFYPTRLVRITLPNTAGIQLVQPSQGVSYAALNFFAFVKATVPLSGRGDRNSHCPATDQQAGTITRDQLYAARTLARQETFDIRDVRAQMGLPGNNRCGWCPGERRLLARDEK